MKATKIKTIKECVIDYIFPNVQWLNFMLQSCDRD